FDRAAGPTQRARDLAAGSRQVDDQQAGGVAVGRQSGQTAHTLELWKKWHVERRVMAMSACHRIRDRNEDAAQLLDAGVEVDRPWAVIVLGPMAKEFRPQSLEPHSLRDGRR